MFEVGGGLVGVVFSLDDFSYGGHTYTGSRSIGCNAPHLDIGACDGQASEWGLRPGDVHA